MNYFRAFFSVLALSWCLTGCSDSNEKSGTPELPPRLAQGKAIVEANCYVCHAQGINGAPIIGNQKMWDKRLPKGVDTLVDHAINGFAGMMPPKGGNQDLTDQEIRLAVEYMVSQVSQ
ncbi:MAG: c-type cytochrome [Ketobacteraceae bacterium]|nr:c-type cytochrome [Ketobacteraceae bacterium]